MSRPEFKSKTSSVGIRPLDSSGNLIYKQLFKDKKHLPGRGQLTFFGHMKNKVSPNTQLGIRFAYCLT